MNIIMDQDFNVQVLMNKAVMVSPEYVGTGAGSGEVMGTGAKDPLLASWPFVIGITAVTLAVSIVLGILLAKKKIKKGYELYED